MNRSTKSLVRAAVIAQGVVMLAVAGTPAHADAGPVAAIFNGLLKGESGQSLSVPDADLAHPSSVLPAGPVSSADGLVSMAKGTASVSRAKDGADQAMATVARGAALAQAPAGGLPDLSRLLSAGDARGVKGLVFSDVTARCVASADGTVSGSTTIDGGRLLGGALSRLPLHPGADYRVPTGDRNFGVTLNKQVKDPAGGMTVTAVSLDGTTAGQPSRDLGVAHCAPVANALTGQRAAARDTVTGPVTALVAPALDQVRTLLGGVTGTAPALPGTITALPALPGGKLPVNSGAVLGTLKDAVPAGLGDALPASPQLNAPALPGQLLGGLPGLPLGQLPV